VGHVHRGPGRNTSKSSPVAHPVVDPANRSTPCQGTATVRAQPDPPELTEVPEGALTPPGSDARRCGADKVRRREVEPVDRGRPRGRSAWLLIGVATLVAGVLVEACSGSTAPSRHRVVPPVSVAASPSSERDRPVAAVPRFPVAVSSDRRYLVDQRGQPYLLVGDSPQCMMANLSPSDMGLFFADRQRYGFNTMWVDVLCGPYTGGRRDFSTYDGIVPFVRPGDISTPNPEYFARLDAMVELARSYGMTLLIQPAETGSFRDLLRSNGTSKDFAYGAFLGARYKDDPNLIWLSGNDYQTDQWETYDPFTTALARGIRSTDPQRLQTVELNFPVSLSTDNREWAGIIDINSAYTYAPTYAEVLVGYNRRPALPVVMIEANYEGEHNVGGPVTTGETLRRQEYWAMLSGAAGQVYGNHYTWGFQYGPWKDKLDTVGAAQVSLMVKLLSSLPWYDLVPDQGHALVTSGFGKATSNGHVTDSDYAAAAMSTDHTVAVVYLPTPRPVTVDLSRFARPVTAKWYDPTSGTDAAAAARPLPAAGSYVFAARGPNSGGDGDWVLVLTPSGGAVAASP